MEESVNCGEIRSEMAKDDSRFEHLMMPPDDRILVVSVYFGET